MADDLIENKPVHTIVRVPENPTGDVWLTLFEAMCLYYAEPPVGEDRREELERHMQERKSACLAEYGLHLNV